MKQKLKTLVISAYHRELRGLADLSHSYQKIEGDLSFLATGIGPGAAAFGLTHFLEDYQPERIISLNTAGLLDTNQFKIGDLAEATSASPASGFSERIFPEVGAKKLKVLTNTPQTDLPKVSVYCPQEITLSHDWAQRLIQNGYQSESCETYIYFFVAQKFKIPITTVLGFTNLVGPNGHKDWKENEERICQNLTVFAQNLL